MSNNNKKIKLENLDHCNDSSMFKAYKLLVDFDSYKLRNEEDIIKFAGQFIEKGPKRKRFLKLFRMSADEFNSQTHST